MFRLVKLFWLRIGVLAVLASAITNHMPGHAAVEPARPAVVRGNEWHLRNSLTTGIGEMLFGYGRATDVPIMGDWDGDGIKTPGVVRGNDWHLKNTNTSGFADIVFAYGKATDIPIVGDWNGDGVDTPGVVRFHVTCHFDACSVHPNTWHLRNSNTTGFADETFEFGSPGFVIAGDWDGDGFDGVGTVNLNSNRWILTNDFNATIEIDIEYGSVGDLPVTGDWDGDLSESVGVVRGNTWFLKNENSNGVADTSFQYGSSTDYPLVWGQGP